MRPGAPARCAARLRARQAGAWWCPQTWGLSTCLAWRSMRAQADRELVAISRALRPCAEASERRGPADTGVSGRASAIPPPRTVPAAWSSRRGGVARLATGRQDGGRSGEPAECAVHPPLAPGAYAWAERARCAGGEREGEGVNEAERERKRARETALLRHSAGLPRGADWQPGSWRTRRSDRLLAHIEPTSSTLRSALRP